MGDTIYRQAAIDKLYKMLHDCFWADDEELDAVITTLNELPSAQPEIVRCKECKYYEIAQLKKDGTDDKRYKPSVCVKWRYGRSRKPDWFCADGERRE